MYLATPLTCLKSRQLNWSDAFGWCEGCGRREQSQRRASTAIQGFASVDTATMEPCSQLHEPRRQDTGEQLLVTEFCSSGTMSGVGQTRLKATKWRCLLRPQSTRSSSFYLGGFSLASQPPTGQPHHSEGNLRSKCEPGFTHSKGHKSEAACWRKFSLTDVSRDSTQAWETFKWPNDFLKIMCFSDKKAGPFGRWPQDVATGSKTLSSGSHDC